MSHHHDIHLDTSQAYQPNPTADLLRFQVSVQILIPLIFYSSQFILLIFHSFYSALSWADKYVYLVAGALWHAQERDVVKPAQANIHEIEK